MRDRISCILGVTTYFGQAWRDPTHQSDWDSWYRAPISRQRVCAKLRVIWRSTRRHTWSLVRVTDSFGESRGWRLFQLFSAYSRRGFQSTRCRRGWRLVVYATYAVACSCSKCRRRTGRENRRGLRPEAALRYRSPSIFSQSAAPLINLLVRHTAHYVLTYTNDYNSAYSPNTIMTSPHVALQSLAIWKCRYAVQCCFSSGE